MSSNQNFRSGGSCHGLLLMTAVSSTLFVGSSVRAQETNKSDLLEEIVVTAERRQTPLQTTPIAISALDAEALQKKEVRRLEDLSFAAPGLSITGNGFINIRGVGVSVLAPAISGGVAVIRDGLFQPETVAQNGEFYDIADIEVLRGPQGTFVGQNSTGGAILINSRSPSLTEDASGNLMLQVGNYRDVKSQGAVNLPISETMAGRLAFSVERRESFYTNLGGERLGGNPHIELQNPGDLNSINLRAGFLWQPNDAFQLLVKDDYAQSKSDGVVSKPIPGTLFASGSPDEPFDISYDAPTSAREQHNMLGVEAKYTFKNGTLFRSMSGWQWNDAISTTDQDFSSNPAIVQWLDIGPDNHYLSQELNLVSSADQRFTWLVGLNYFQRTTPVLLSQNATLDINWKNELTNEAAFGQVGFKILSNLELTVGGRYSKDKAVSSGETVFSGFHIPNTGEYSVETPTGKVALNWTLSPEHFFYAFYARGYKPGGIAEAGKFYDAEHVNDYEAGWKGTLLDRHLSAQVGAYYMKYSDFQFETLNEITGRTGLVSNVADSKIQGVEAAVQLSIKSLRLDASFAYVDATLSGASLIEPDLLPDSGGGTLGPQCVVGGAPTCFNYAPYATAVDGARNPYAPEWTYNFTASYEFNLPSGVLSPSITYSHVADQWNGVFQDPSNERLHLLESRNLVSAQLTYYNGPWRTELYGRNLGDEVYLATKSGSTQAYGDPRQYGVRIARSFGD